MDLLVRSATVEDAAELARLSVELGYPATLEEILLRLGQLFRQEQFVAVAAQLEPGLLGWISAESRVSLEAGQRAEITGLVVDSRARRAGVGAQLVAAAENWARRSGHDAIVVRSNASRVESHPFYAASGYLKAKTQHVYSKRLAV